MAELGVIVNHFALAEHFNCIVYGAMQREETLTLFLASKGVILQPVHQIPNVFSSQVLKCLQTFPCSFYHTSSLLQGARLHKKL